MPPKKKTEAASRRRSTRIEKQQQVQQEKEEKKRTNLKDLLNKNSQRSKRKSGIETDGDFVFKRTASQLEEKSSSQPKSKPKAKPSQPKPNGSTSRPASKRSKPSSKGIRKLTEHDITITPEISRINDTYEEHSTSIQVALPISDSPIIRRNKELRNNGSSVRRSSLGNRGKRVSSIGNGFQAIPHEKVPKKEFYKHLDTSLPEPHRMRQLLSWCSQRIFDQDKDRHIKRKNKLPNEELTALNIAKVIKEELVRDLINGKIGISWWNKDDDDDVNEKDNENEPKILLPNEKNVKNLSVLNDLTKRLEELKKNSGIWEANLSQQIELPSELSIDKASIPHNNEAIKKLLDSSIIDEISKIEDSTLNDISTNLENSIDEFNDIVHKLKSSSSIRKKYIELKSSKLSEILDSTFNDDSLKKIPLNEINKELDTDQLLKGISMLD